MIRVRRWTLAWEKEGAEGLRPEKPGPKLRSKLTDELGRQIRRLHIAGNSLAGIAETTGVSTDTVRRAIAEGDGTDGPAKRSTKLVPLARPSTRAAERALDRAGLLAGAYPVICEGESLPRLGALVVLPALMVTGLIDPARSVYRVPRAAFFSLCSLLVRLASSCLLGEARAEGLTRLDPVAMGRLVGLDRA